VITIPYKTNNELPSTIRKLPYKAQSLYRSSFNSSYSRTKSDSIASKVAWTVVKKRFKKVDGNWIAKGLSNDFYSFTMNTNSNEMFISKAKDGEYYLEATLSDDKPDSDGKRFTSESLKDYADQINNYGIAGFITHADWDAFKMKYGHLSEQAFVAKARLERRGILKTVKAIYEKGKLWIKALIDKRYLNHVKKFNKVSIEALVPSRFQGNNEYRGGHVLGFALDNNAINPRATIV